MKQTLFFALSLLTLAPAGLAQAVQDPKPTPSDDYSGEAWITLSQQRNVRFENDGTGREESTTRVRIQSDAGVRQWGQIVQGYVAAFDSIEFKDARVVKPDGSVWAIPLDRIMELTSPVAAAFPSYNDLREKHLAVPDLRVGDVLEYAVVRTTHTALAPGQFWFSAYLSRMQIALEEAIEIDVPGDRVVNLRTGDGLTPTVTEGANRRVYRIVHSMANLAEVEQQRKLARRRQEAPPPDLVVSSFRSWEEFGNWYRGLEKDRRAPTPEIRAKAAELTRGLRTDIEKTQALYDYVATKVRYVALSFGQGAVQPHAASETLSNGYGDCKDKHTLLSALLATVGIEADAAPVGTQRNADASVPYLQFDHLISAVRVGKEQDYLWLDTTAEVGPFRWLSPNLRGRRALVVSPKAPARLIETPANPPLASETSIEVDASLDASGRWSTKQRESYRGDVEVAPRMGMRLTPRGQWKSLMERVLRYESKGRQSLPEGIEIDADDPAATREPFSVRLSYALPNVVDLSQKRPVLYPPASSGHLPSSEDLALTEEGELELGGPLTTRYAARIEVPVGWTATPNDPISAIEDFGEYHATSSFEGRTLSIERRLALKIRRLPASRAAAYDQWRAKFVEEGRSGFYLELADPDAAKTDYEAGLAFYKAGQHAKAVDSFKKTLATIADHKDAWDALGRAYVGLRKSELAIQAFRKQIEIVPGHFAAHLNLGRALRVAGQFKDAEAASKKAVDLEPENADARWNLGALYLVQKQYSDALPSLEKAAALNNQNASIHIDLARALLGLNQDEKAFAALDTAVMLRPEPLIWNNAAWYLSLAGKRLDRAQEWAESAVVSTAARFRSVVPETIGDSNVAMARSLVSYWDTLGWVHFQRGDFEGAEPYLRAALALFPQREIAEHHAQLTAGRASVAPPSSVSLSGVALTRPTACTDPCSAGFFVALASTGKVSAVKFATGDPALEPSGKSLVGLSHDLRFPDAMPTQVVVPATLACPASGDCHVAIGPRSTGGSLSAPP